MPGSPTCNLMRKPWQNGLELNIKKTKVMIFGSLQYLTTLSKRPQPLPQIQINDIPLPYFEIVKNLAIIMTRTLNWQPQVTAITNKVFPTLSSLKFHKIAKPNTQETPNRSTRSTTL